MKAVTVPKMSKNLREKKINVRYGSALYLRLDADLFPFQFQKKIIWFRLTLDMQ